MIDAVIKGTVALVSKNEQTRKLDRQALKLLGCSNVVVLPAGGEAVDYIIAERPALVLACGDADDLDACALLNQMRLAGRNMPPTVVVTSENREQAVLDAITAGCSGYVLRPYTLTTFRKHIELAQSLGAFLEIEHEQLGVAQELLEAGDFDAALDEYEEVLTANDEAQRYFNQGIKALGNKKYGQAIIAFNKALRLSELYADAYKGVADAYRGKGDMGKYEENLKRAADIFAQQGRFEETKQIFADILKLHSAAINPYNTLGVTLRKNGDYPGAINAYKQAIVLTPTDENIYYNLAKASHTFGQRDKARKYIDQALALNPDFVEAQRLQALIAGEPVAPVVAAQGERSLGNAWRTTLDD